MDTSIHAYRNMMATVDADEADRPYCLWRIDRNTYRWISLAHRFGSGF